IFDLSPEVIILANRRGIVLDVNNKIYDWLKIDPGGIVGKNILTLPFCTRKDKLETIRRFRQTMQGKESLPIEVEFLASGNSLRIGRLIESPIRDDKGDIVQDLIMISDITGQKKIEQALVDNTERYRTLFESANDAIFLMEGEIFVECNQKTLEMFACTSEQIIGQPPYRFSPEKQPDGRNSMEKAHEKIDAAFRGEPQFFQWLHCRYDGTPFYAEVSLNKIELSGKLHLLAVVRDVTKRKEAEEELSKTQALLSAAIEQTPAGIIIAEAPDGRIRVANSEALGIPGNTNDNFTEIPPHFQPENWQTFYPDGKPFKPEELPLARALFRGETIKNLDVVIRGKDGEDRWILENAAPVRNSKGEIVAGVLVLSDITERRRVEKEMNLLAHAIMSISECVSITDMDDNIILLNDAFLKTYGYEKEELLGKPISIVRSENISPEIASGIRPATLRGGWQGEILNKRKDGTEFPLFLSTSVIRDEFGKPVAMIGVARDISERKQLEEHFRQVQKLEAIGRLAGGVAHDFNNLLTVIRGYCELILAKLPQADPLYRRIRQIDKAGSRAESLTRQLLAFSRKQILHPRLLDFNDLLREMEEMLRRLIKEDIELQTILEPGDHFIKADSGQIQQVVMNLVVNARDAMPEGGRIIMETKSVVFDHSYIEQHSIAKPGHYVMLSITDSGHGIDKETQARIFEPFFTTKKSGSGTGLGLATVYGIVKQSDGYIWVYSEPGMGTTFKVYLPLFHEEVATDEEIIAEEENLQGQETVLLVEDEEEVRNFISLTLKRYGYTVLESEHGEDALRKSENFREPIHLLLTDVIMPQMNGRELVEKISSKRPETKVLYMSGYTDTVIVDKGVLEEDTEFIQ
ncbi:MAG: PAS domain S-box protein, partial [Calditrichia bacterium]